MLYKIESTSRITNFHICIFINHLYTHVSSSNKIYADFDYKILNLGGIGR